ncbi:hypothetical protein H6P81_018810 [Aristolochia fimbriata]|uniref:Uncharacterized protein n=1 Tax=Aristolochia fimbriata TaxID=158543 RepID=A0AAV7E3K1_ARIFI|nr:hypothetical protein H6P81_018810 [Aristolochia fimbriata]
MSSLRFHTPSLPAIRSNRRRPRAAPTPSAVPAAEPDSLRLEPRVEERDADWVLKEKFRQGINPQEKVKLEKEPMKLIVERGIEELANTMLEEIRVPNSPKTIRGVDCIGVVQDGRIVEQGSHTDLVTSWARVRARARAR